MWLAQVEITQLKRQYSVPKEISKVRRILADIYFLYIHVSNSNECSERFTQVKCPRVNYQVARYFEHCMANFSLSNQFTKLNVHILYVHASDLCSWYILRSFLGYSERGYLTLNPFGQFTLQLRDVLVEHT